ncbi:MAG: type IV toxin-antitoxin system AbiEi family antitoxin [Rickettsia endosymbiont of Oxypoda opaca]|nr:type IV toxin-antitoxin system AbiEi family antitoxin [Rickettsia endosymbiont of Oxypoda opaca]
MYYEYVENLRSFGKRYFTSEEIRKELNISGNAAKAGLYRLKKDGKLISPLSGLYVIVPPENRSYGSIPAEELVPIIMRYLGAEYYVGLLSAAAYFGAAHQKSARFQVISNKRIKHSLKFGRIIIELVYKASLANLPTQGFVVSTGYLKVATPELVAIDLFKYPKRVGGISHIATILSELVENINVSKLITLAENTNELCQIQRIGYVVEQIEIMDASKKNNLLTLLESYLKNIKRPYISLVPNMPKTGAARSKKWKIIENSDFESDL